MPPLSQLAIVLAASVVLQLPAAAQQPAAPDTGRKHVQMSVDVGPSARRNRDTTTIVRDSSDSAGARRGRHGGWDGPARRLPVTAQVLATAFHDPTARATLERARIARMSQDSALAAYDATAYQRVSAGMGFSRFGRDRLIYRGENVSRIRWQRGVGAWVDVKGARAVIPIDPDPEDAADEQQDAITDVTIPYFPGHESLWIGGGIAKAQVNDREFVHPLATGAEAYYLYRTGDSISVRLPGGRVIRLRELQVRPRVPQWNVVVGSLWFDTESGQLVRAAYRFSTPLDVWAKVKEDDSTATDDIPVWVKPLISPIHAQVTAVAVEYGLYDARFWLPRVQAAEGSAQVSFMRVPFKLEQSYRYASVNARDSLPPIPVDRARMRLDTLPDSLAEHLRDSLRTARRARRDSVRKGLVPSPPSQCDTSAYRVETRSRYNAVDDGIRIAFRVPCDTKALATSPDLPPSIYDPGDEIFGAKERDALIAEALSLGAQPPFLLGSGRLPPPTVSYGLQYVRYNRVEGLSAGAQVDQPLGGGYTARALGRLGLADLEPNLDLSLDRTNLTRTIYVSGYNHLVSANDWGNPLSFGSSLSALLFGRDEGFYYRATGVEVGARRDPRSEGAHLDWRLFFEGERSARQETDFSLGPAFIANVEATRARYAGGALRLNHTAGLDPRGLRVLSDVRLEAASSVARADSADARYARAAADLTFSHGLPAQLIGALTLSGGTTAGTVPPQRRWFLGGTQTIRGESPDTALSGNAYWMTRAELGRDYGPLRPVVFGDVGWVGHRAALYRRDIGRPMSGVGTGASIMDGLVRFDIARGLYPEKRWRLSLYVEARF
ncbi:MAG TPA: ShlB/FhaC/HecB family hemolysin secretion/activation protein [Gemmatimonadaceae bacterium]|nr:ShlB/FhaC/HecB family hemolysin secretion/activation protein [Gemmatimonadaceae bacterium]